MRKFEIWTTASASPFSPYFCIRDEESITAGAFFMASEESAPSIREYANLFCRAPALEKTLKDISKVIKDTSAMPSSIYGLLDWNVDVLNSVKAIAKGDFSSDVRRTFFYDDGLKRKNFVSSDTSLTLVDETHYINCDKFGVICQIDDEKKYDSDEKLSVALLFKYAGLMRNSILSIEREVSNFTSSPGNFNAFSRCDWYAKRLSLIGQIAKHPIQAMEKEFQDLIDSDEYNEDLSERECNG